MKSETIAILLLAIFILAETETSLAEEEVPEKYTDTVFSRGRAHIIYIFDSSLLEKPIGIDTLPEVFNDLESAYLGSHVSSKNLRGLYGKIKIEIENNSDPSVEDSLSFVHLEPFKEDQNLIILTHTENPKISFCYDGLLFWQQLQLEEIRVKDLLSFENPTVETLLSTDDLTYSKQTSKLMTLFGNLLKDSDSHDISESVDQDVTVERKYCIILLEPYFILLGEDQSYECDCTGRNSCGDYPICYEGMEKLMVYYPKYSFNRIGGWNFSNENTYIALIDHPLREYELGEHMKRFNNLIILMNMKRALHEFNSLLHEEYNGSPKFYCPYTAYKKIRYFEKVETAASSFSYILSQFEENPFESNPNHPTINYSEELASTYLDLAMAKEDTANQVRRNEHALTTFGIVATLITAALSLLISLKRKKRSSAEDKSKYCYIISFILVAVFMLILCCCNARRTENAYYFLSALVQSEAAVLGIVVTLSLVVVQLTASSYSPRVTQVFRKTPDLWMLILLYIAAIATCLVLLRVVSENPQAEFEVYIDFSYFLGIFCFTFLLPYTYRFFCLINPGTFIRKLAEEIDSDNLIGEDLSLTEWNDSDSEDPLESILDIARSSLMKYDYETLKLGLRMMRNRICCIIQDENIQKSEAEAISKNVYRKLYQFCQFAIDRADEFSIMEVISTIKEIGKAPIREGSERDESRAFEKVMCGASQKIGYIGKAAAEKRLRKSAHWAVLALGEIGRLSVKRKLNQTTLNAINHLRKIGRIIMKRGKIATNEKTMLLGIFKEIGMMAVGNRMSNVAENAVECLGELVEVAGYKIEKEEYEKVVRVAKDSLMRFLDESARVNLEEPRIAAVKYLGKLVGVIRDRGLDVDISDVEEELSGI